MFLRLLLDLRSPENSEINQEIEKVRLNIQFQASSGLLALVTTEELSQMQSIPDGCWRHFLEGTLVSR